MKRSWSKDERVQMVNGQVSPTRVIVVEGLEAQGKEGATLDELTQLIGQDIGGERPKQGISKALNMMADNDHVQFVRGRWYLTEHAPKPATNGHAPDASPVYSQINESPRPVTFNGKRSEKQVSLYTSPRVFSDVISISLLIAQRWYRLPLFGSVRICIGFEAPNWSPDQEMFTDVEVIKIVHTGGKVTEERPAPKDLVTVAPEV